MLKVLEQAIAAEGGDPAELERIRVARKILREYRRLRKQLGLAAIDDERDGFEDGDNKAGR